MKYKLFFLLPLLFCALFAQAQNHQLDGAPANIYVPGAPIVATPVPPPGGSFRIIIEDIILGRTKEVLRMVTDAVLFFRPAEGGTNVRTANE